MKRKGKTHRFFTALLNDVNSARRMIKEGFDINTLNEDEDPLNFAVRHGNLPAVKLLLDHGVKPRIIDQALLAVFKCCGHKTRDNYILYTLYTNILKLLLKHGADCNAPAGIFATPLLLAFESASLEWVKLLLEYGARATAVDIFRKTALHYAALNPRLNVIEFALDHLGLDIDKSDICGWSALYDAASNNNISGCEFLLKRGAMVDKTCYSGGTLLSEVVNTVTEETIQLLLDYGADVSHKSRGESVLEIAAKGDNVRIVVRHIARMEHVNRGADEYDLQTIRNNNDYNRYYQNCLQELQEMEVTNFYNKLSVFGVLTKRKKMISRYVRDEELVKALEKENCDVRFPIYFNCLKKRFYAEVKRHSAAKLLGNLFGFNDPLHIVNQKIVSYLMDKDLERLKI